MSTELEPVVEVDGCPEVAMTQFFGGQDRGLCVQFTQFQRDGGNHQFIQCNKEQAKNLALAILEWLDDDRKRE